MILPITYQFLNTEVDLGGMQCDDSKISGASRLCKEAGACSNLWGLGRREEEDPGHSFILEAAPRHRHFVAVFHTFGNLRSALEALRLCVKKRVKRPYSR